MGITEKLGEIGVQPARSSMFCSKIHLSQAFERQYRGVCEIYIYIQSSINFTCQLVVLLLFRLLGPVAPPGHMRRTPPTFPC
jgi:hypothetical protein